MLAAPLCAEESAISNSPISGAFAETTARIDTMPDSVGVPVEWEFTNHWHFPLMIERVDESCGCLSGEIGAEAKKAVAPGETGRVKATFTPGAYRGLVRKSLHVCFVGHEGAVELVAEAQVPQPVELSARELFWKADARTATREVEVTSGTDADFTITGLSGVSDGHFVISEEILAPSRHYRLSIRPSAAVPAGVHTLLVRTDSADPRDRVVAIFLNMP